MAMMPFGTTTGGLGRDAWDMNQGRTPGLFNTTAWMQNLTQAHPELGKQLNTSGANWSGGGQASWGGGQLADIVNQTRAKEMSIAPGSTGNNPDNAIKQNMQTGSTTPTFGGSPVTNQVQKTAAPSLAQTTATQQQAPVSYANSKWFNDPMAFRNADTGGAYNDGDYFVLEDRAPGTYNGMDNYTEGDVRRYIRSKYLPGHSGNATGSVAKYNGQEYEIIDPKTGQVVGTDKFSGLGDGMTWKQGLGMIAASMLGANFMAGNLPGMTPNPMPGGVVPPGMEGVLPPTSTLPPGYGSVPGGSGVPGAPGNNPSAYVPPGSEVIPPPTSGTPYPPGTGDYGPVPDYGPPSTPDLPGDWGPTPTDPMGPPGSPITGIPDQPIDLGPPNYSDVGPMPPEGPAPNNPGGTPISNPGTPTTPPGGKVPGTGGGTGGNGSGNGGISLGDIISLVGGAYGAKAKKQASDDMLAWLNTQQKKVDDLYAPGSPEYNYLMQEMSRKDAAAGRNSQYGPRSVDLAAKIAGIKADNTAKLTTGIGHTYAAALNSGADAYAGIPALLANMGGNGGSFLNNINIGDFFDEITKIFS